MVYTNCMRLFGLGTLTIDCTPLYIAFNHQRAVQISAKIMGSYEIVLRVVPKMVELVDHINMLLNGYLPFLQQGKSLTPHSLN